MIEMVSMQMLTESESDPVLKEVISSLDLAVIGEKGILQAAGVDTMQRIRETEENDFSDEFLRRVERNRKSVFIIGETQRGIPETGVSRGGGNGKLCRRSRGCDQ